MNSSERARSIFAQGTNCAQAVFLGCAHGKLNETEMLKVASCFGGGMSHTDQACGAVTGGLMALGSAVGMEHIGDRERKTSSGEAGERFVKLFRERFGSVRCTALIDFNLSNAAELEAARASGVFSTACPTFVEHAAELVERVLQERSEAAGPRG